MVTKFPMTEQTLPSGGSHRATLTFFKETGASQIKIHFPNYKETAKLEGRGPENTLFKSFAHACCRTVLIGK